MCVPQKNQLAASCGDELGGRITCRTAELEAQITHVITTDQVYALRSLGYFGTSLLRSDVRAPSEHLAAPDGRGHR